MVWCCGKTAVVHVVEHKYEKISKHIICDDSSQNRMILARMLRKMLHVEVDEAENAEQVFACVKQNGEYAVLWQDFALGDNQPNGGEICTMLRKQYQYKGVIIALTGFTDQKTQETCRACGMNAFVGKPFDVKRVRELGLKYAYPPVSEI